MRIKIPFDPIERGLEVEKVVCRDNERKYYRFRFARYYGGIITADTVGCCFLCAYCWNYFKNLNPKKFGEFYSSSKVFEKMMNIYRSKKVKKFRISGAEPILGENSFNYLLEILDLFKQEFNDDLIFILETNGLFLGYFKEDFIPKLKKYKDFLYVRISIKGYNEEIFEKVTGAKKGYFKYPLIAFNELRKSNIKTWIAVMYDIFGNEGVIELIENAWNLGVEISPQDIEFEFLEKYNFVIKNLKERGLI